MGGHPQCRQRSPSVTCRPRGRSSTASPWPTSACGAVDAPSASITAVLVIDVKFGDAHEPAVDVGANSACSTASRACSLSSARRSTSSPPGSAGAATVDAQRLERQVVVGLEPRDRGPTWPGSAFDQAGRRTPVRGGGGRAAHPRRGRPAPPPRPRRRGQAQLLGGDRRLLEQPQVAEPSARAHERDAYPPPHADVRPRRNVQRPGGGPMPSAKARHAPRRGRAGRECSRCGRDGLAELVL